MSVTEVCNDTVAASALADVGDERAIAPIRAMADSHPNPQLRESAEQWLEKLEKAQQETNTASDDRTID